MKTWIIGAAAGLLALTLFAFAPGGAATVQAEGACGNEIIDVPDSGASFDFTEACEAHDECYAVLEAGGDEGARKACDDTFLDAMLTSCDSWPSFSWDRFVCVFVAKVYYAGVRIGGAFFL